MNNLLVNAQQQHRVSLNFQVLIVKKCSKVVSRNEHVFPKPAF